MTPSITFDQAFNALTEFNPLSWHRRLFDDYLSKGALPSGVDIPTGLGKTNVMAIWLLARAKQAIQNQDGRSQLPRRLLYVVDRRAVVDQATSAAEKIRDRLHSCLELESVCQGLGLDAGQKLPISTLRGQHTDNRDWLTNPAGSAIIVGTVDMIGSRLLFSGYGVSRKMRPYHAGLLGADTLVVLDEAHLVRPFADILREVTEGRETFGPCEEKYRSIVPPLKLLTLSATGREGGESKKRVFSLSEADRRDAIVEERLKAAKHLTIQVLDDAQELVPRLAELAWKLGNGPARVVIYCHSRGNALKVRAEIDKKCKSKRLASVSELLVGGRRVFERERLYDWLQEHGFFCDAQTPPEQPTFLIATSAGEVGVDLDADHMVCDLVEWERMVQRFGRVNRLGQGNARIQVVAAPSTKQPSNPAKLAEWQQQWNDRLSRLRKPLDELCVIDMEETDIASDMWRTEITDHVRDASPGAILELRKRSGQDEVLREALKAATTPTPLRPTLTRALVDAWSQTSLDKHTGRPNDIQPWLRGWEEKQVPQTTIVWRTYMPVRADGTETPPRDMEAFFDAAPPHTSEKLETETDIVLDWLVKRTKKLNDGGERDKEIVGCVLSASRSHPETLTYKDFGITPANKEKLKKLLRNATLVLDACFGGLSEQGMLDHTAESHRTIDSGGDWMPLQDNSPAIRFRVRSVISEDGAKAFEGWRERYRFVVKQSNEGEAQEILIVEKWRDDSETEDDRSVGHLQELDEHHAWTEEKARAMAEKIGLTGEYADMLATAARLHDEGKRHSVWQMAARSPTNAKVFAKTNKRMNTRLLDGYRHEFGSLPYVEKDDGFGTLSLDLQELLLHMIAAHHGWARPVISAVGASESHSVLKERTLQIALRFGRLQKRWGPWGLAWWEALLRAADQQASKENDEREDNVAGRAQ